MVAQLRGPFLNSSVPYLIVMIHGGFEEDLEDAILSAGCTLNHGGNLRWRKFLNREKKGTPGLEII